MSDRVSEVRYDAEGNRYRVSDDPLECITFPSSRGRCGTPVYYVPNAAAPLEQKARQETEASEAEPAVKKPKIDDDIIVISDSEVDSATADSTDEEKPPVSLAGKEALSEAKEKALVAAAADSTGEEKAPLSPAEKALVANEAAADKSTEDTGEAAEKAAGEPTKDTVKAAEEPTEGHADKSAVKESAVEEPTKAHAEESAVEESAAEEPTEGIVEESAIEEPTKAHAEESAVDESAVEESA